MGWGGGTSRELFGMRVGWEEEEEDILGSIFRWGGGGFHSDVQGRESIFNIQVVICKVTKCIYVCV